MRKSECGIKRWGLKNVCDGKRDRGTDMYRHTEMEMKVFVPLLTHLSPVLAAAHGVANDATTRMHILAYHRREELARFGPDVAILLQRIQ